MAISPSSTAQAPRKGLDGFGLRAANRVPFDRIGQHEALEGIEQLGDQRLDLGFADDLRGLGNRVGTPPRQHAAQQRHAPPRRPCPRRAANGAAEAPLPVGHVWPWADSERIAAAAGAPCSADAAAREPRSVANEPAPMGLSSFVVQPPCASFARLVRPCSASHRGQGDLPSIQRTWKSRTSTAPSGAQSE